MCHIERPNDSCHFLTSHSLNDVCHQFSKFKAHNEVSELVSLSRKNDFS